MLPSIYMQWVQGDHECTALSSNKPETDTHKFARTPYIYIDKRALQLHWKRPTILHFHVISICVWCVYLALRHLDTLATATLSFILCRLWQWIFLVQTFITNYPSAVRKFGNAANFEFFERSLEYREHFMISQEKECVFLL